MLDDRLYHYKKVACQIDFFENGDDMLEPL